MKINSSEDTRNQNLITTIVFFSYYHKPVKTTIKRGRLLWLKSADDSQKIKRKDFWKCLVV
jgi:hypothetical protein